MSFGRNLAKARSHIMLVLGLLAASGVILVLEQKEEEAALARARAAAPAPAGPRPAIASLPAAARSPTEWRVQLGAFSSAEAAGREWDRLRSEVPGLDGRQALIVPAGPILRLQSGPISSRAQVDALCRAAYKAGEECLMVPPLDHSGS
jgi:cell division septation protein DedD